MNSPRLVILDRDGVINADSAEFIKSPAEWQPLPGSLDALARLHRAGWTVVVASNQSGVGRGLLSLTVLAQIHDLMQEQVRAAGGVIDRVFFCPHAPEADCDCRKPRPGLLRQIEAAYGVGLGGVPAIGDSVRDVEAARAAGARPMLVLTGNGVEAARLTGVESYADLGTAVDALLREGGQ